jgi:hypothetical protein
MAAIVSALFIGALFGFGLALSEMTDPARVIGFLDVAGRWDPTLLFVIGGALAVTVPAFSLILRRPRPLLAEFFALPTKSKIDGSLIAGAIIFGLGWGIAGFCPGPALAALATGSPSVAFFVVAMIAGQWAASLLEKRP